MTGRIYHLSDDGDLEPMSEQPYGLERDLQELLETHPELIPGELIGRVAPCRWLLVERESSIADCENRSKRWSVDHLFVDQFGIPTLVEVKRSTDSRIRREVVGQMLDYAANAVAFSSVDPIREKFRRTQERDDRDPALVLREFLDRTENEEVSEDEFWSGVETNLAAGRIRLIFLSDDIPRELRQIVEFLNEQMNPAEVLAVEIRQFVGEGRRTLVPALVGRTAQSDARKSNTAPREPWNESEFLGALRTSVSETAAEVAASILEWCRTNNAEIDWSTAARGSFSPWFWMDERKAHRFKPFRVLVTGRVEIPLMRERNKPPFDDVELRREWVRWLNKIDGWNVDESYVDEGIPMWSLDDLAVGDRLASFLKVAEWSSRVARGMPE